MRRTAIGLLVLAVAVGLWRWRATGDAGPRPSWQIEHVDRGPVVASVTATGSLGPVESVDVGTYVSGPIAMVAADFNSSVRRGQLLARIDPRPFETKLHAAEADLRTARAQVQKARADAALRARTLSRMRQLHARGIVAQSDLDQAESDAEQARAEIALQEAAVQSAEAKAEEARVNLAYTEIRSPVDGVVVSRNVSPGQTVAASFQTPTLFTVAADLTRMEVSANVSESDIGGVAVGQDVTFTVDAWPNDVFHGTVAQVRNAPITVQNVVTYDVLVRVDNHELKLKPGMTANVTIVTAKRDDVLRVPTAALRFRPPSDATTEEPRPGTRVVWQPDDDGRATAVPVAIGVNDDRWTELVRGLDAGAPVVVGIARDPDEGAERPLLPFGASPPRHRR